MEEPVAHADVRPGQRVQDRRLAGVGVAGERDVWQVRALALAAHGRPRSPHLLELASQGCDPVAREPAVGLDLRLARASRADAGAEAHEMRPEAAHPRQVVLELCQLDLQLALGGVRVQGEDVEDHRRAVDDRHAECLLEVALLPRRQLVVARDQVGVESLGELLDLDELAGAQIGVGVRPVAMLHDLADGRRPGGAQQLFEL